MKITFYEGRSELKYNPNTAKNIGIGGLETCLIELSREFAKRGHDVTCFVRCNTPDLYEGVKFYDISSYKPNNTNLFIGLESFPQEIHAEKVVNWVHRNEIASARIPEVDKIVLVSEWQKDYFIKGELSSDLVSKIEVISNGVNLELFAKSGIAKKEFSIVYATFPTKGLIYLSKIFPRIRERVPQANLHVYSGAGLWGWDNEQFRPMYNQMIKERIHFHGQEGKQNLAKRLNEYKVYLYPCTFLETFCLSILEAMAAGCVPVTTSMGNLPNIIENGETGYAIEGNPKDFVWQHEAADRVKDLLLHPSKFEKMSKAAREFASQFTWSKAAKRFEDLL